MKVVKFGGSSLADAAQIRKVCDIVAADGDRRVVVVSAPGKKNEHDVKVTDLLISMAGEASAGRDTERAYAALIERYRVIVEELRLETAVLEHIANDLRERLEMPREPAPRFLDAVKAAGEDYCARLVAEALTARGIKAVYLCPREAGMLLEGEFGDGQVLPETPSRLASYLKKIKDVVVFPGFFGVTPAGETITFSRGGSDVTGAILAAALGVDTYENFTDVDGVFCADPRLIPEARPIPELTYRELRELAYSGFGVFHEEAVIHAVRAGIPIHILNTENPEGTGTRILPLRRFCQGEVAGISGQEGFCSINLSKFLMNREIGFGRRMLAIFEEEGLSYEHVPSGIDNISIILSSEDFTPVVEKRVVEKIFNELKVDTLDVERGLALIMVVGEGMRYSVGLAGRAAGALARAGINIEMMNQGASEISMMFGVKEKDFKGAVRALFDEFFAFGPVAGDKKTAVVRDGCGKG